jgi:hypothetical protein
MWTDEQTEQLRTLASEGKSSGEIAEWFGVTRNAVAGKCHREGVRLKSGPRTHKSRVSAGVKASWARDDGTRRQKATDRILAYHAARRQPQTKR